MLNLNVIYFSIILSLIHYTNTENEKIILNHNFIKVRHQSIFD
jgi:hypothetical protein